MNTALANNVCVSFVHGFHDTVASRHDRPAPALWEIAGDEERTHRYVFPIDPKDFDALECPIVGEPPLTRDAVEKRPRYGFTGLERAGDHLYAASWNGIYRLDAATKEPLAFISNRYTCYLHRFHVDERNIIVAMPFKDLVVIMDHEGRVRDALSIDRSLRIRRDEHAAAADWRFLNKPWSGSCGYYHLNNVQLHDGKILLTSRNLGAIIEVDPTADRGVLRTLNYHTPTCIHDGDRVDGRFYFTSIDGKVIVASEPPEHDRSKFNYDLQAEHHRLDEVEKNWCRGLAVRHPNVYVTIDGRYDTDLSFKLLELDEAFKPTAMRKFEWSNVGDEADIRFVTGFDIVVED